MSAFYLNTNLSLELADVQFLLRLAVSYSLCSSMLQRIHVLAAQKMSAIISMG